jgi:hypothetical protein
MRLFTACIESIGNNNIKVAALGFDCLQMIIEGNCETFSPFANMTFDSILTKFTDSKVMD